MHNRDSPAHVSPDLTQAITKACAKRGMLLMTAGVRECLRFLPPLNVTASEVAKAVEIFSEAQAEVLET